MKRFFFTAIALTALAVSCTKSGLIESPQTYQDPITFEPYTGKALATKASVAETKDIYSGFRVIGFEEGTSNVTTGNPYGITASNPYLRKMVTSTNGTSWTYNGAMYWPQTSNLTFVAYGLNFLSAPTAIAEVEDAGYGDVTTDADDIFAMGLDYTTFTYSVPEMVAKQKDLIISPALHNCASDDASGTFDSGESDKVNIKFFHVLSRIGFQVRTTNTTVTENGTTAKVSVKDVQLHGSFPKSATFNLLTAVTATSTTANGSTTYTTDYSELTTSGTTTMYSIFDTNSTEFKESEHPVFITNGSKGNVTNGIGVKDFPIYDNATYDATAASYSEPTSTSETNKDNRYMMVLPCTVGDVTEAANEDLNGNGTTGETLSPFIKVVYQITDAEEQTAYISLPKKSDNSNFTFEAGKAYEFIFTISTDAVGFTVDVEPWDTNIDDKEETTDDNIYPDLVPEN